MKKKQYTASAKTQSLEPTDKALKNLQATLHKDPKLSNILASPTLKAGDKKLVVAEVLKVSGSDKTIKNLLEVLAENNRLNLLNGIIEKYGVLMGAHRGEVETIISSAVVSRVLREIGKWY